jgi:MoxR-like ATPase
MTAPVQQLQQLRQDLVARFPERREVIEGTLYALLSKDHILLVGPPGTAKSSLARAVAQAFGARYFERLLTKFSTPEELFGPVSLKALENDRYIRITTDKLPEAEIGVIDETFKANSAILNTLLTLMNERLFHNDGQPTPCPLVTLFGASNELPEGKELEALFDRFLLRYEVSYLLRSSNLRAVLTAPDPTPPTSMSMDDLRAAQAEGSEGGAGRTCRSSWPRSSRHADSDIPRRATSRSADGVHSSAWRESAADAPCRT